MGGGVMTGLTYVDDWRQVMELHPASHVPTVSGPDASA
jgi:hypothetical protein